MVIYANLLVRWVRIYNAIEPNKWYGLEHVF